MFNSSVGSGLSTEGIEPLASLFAHTSSIDKFPDTDNSARPDAFHTQKPVVQTIPSADTKAEAKVNEIKAEMAATLKQETKHEAAPSGLLGSKDAKQHGDAKAAFAEKSHRALHTKMETLQKKLDQTAETPAVQASPAHIIPTMAMTGFIGALLGASNPGLGMAFSIVEAASATRSLAGPLLHGPASNDAGYEINADAPTAPKSHPTFDQGRMAQAYSSLRDSDYKGIQYSLKAIDSSVAGRSIMQIDHNANYVKERIENQRANGLDPANVDDLRRQGFTGLSANQAKMELRA